METLITHDQITEQITLNYRRLLDSRANGDTKELQDTFEQRMNQALDEYGDLCKFTSRQLVETMVVGD